MFLRRGVMSVALVTVLALGACEKPAQPAAETAAAPAATAEAAPAPVATAVTPVANPGTVETGGTCGTIAGLTCKSPKDFCKRETGQCAVADASGVCATMKPECPKILLPVCDCEGKEHANACEAAAAGKNVDYVGECKKPT